MPHVISRHQRFTDFFWPKRVMGLVVTHDPRKEGEKQFGVTGVRSFPLHSFIED